jgi:hypothetical protein
MKLWVEVLLTLVKEALEVTLMEMVKMEMAMLVTLVLVVVGLGLLELE